MNKTQTNLLLSKILKVKLPIEQNLEVRDNLVKLGLLKGVY